MKTKIINQTRYGLYIWTMPNGAIVMDEDRNILNIPSEYGDLKKIAEITKVAKSFGINEGQPTFLPGHRRVSDSEYEDQKDRLAAGLTPDPYDYGVGLDDSGR